MTRSAELGDRERQRSLTPAPRMAENACAVAFRQPPPRPHGRVGAESAAEAEPHRQVRSHPRESRSRGSRHAFAPLHSGLRLNGSARAACANGVLGNRTECGCSCVVSVCRSRRGVSPSPGLRKQRPGDVAQLRGRLPIRWRASPSAARIRRSMLEVGPTQVSPRAPRQNRARRRKAPWVFGRAAP